MSPNSRRFYSALLGALALLAAMTLQAEPVQRIVSLAPHLTELAFTAGAGDRVVATVEYSDYPPQARQIPRIGNAFRVDMERLLALQPDVVLVWETGMPVQVIDRLRSLKLRVAGYDTQRLADIPIVLRAIGQLAGTGAVADEAARRFERDISELRARYRDRPSISVFLQVNDRPLYTVNGKQIMSEIVELCGGRNVFADLNELAPTIGIEAVLAADPQVIISTDDTVPDAAEMWRDWRQMAAVRSNNVYTLRSDNIARATTRLTLGAQEICRTLDTARQRVRPAVNR